MASNPNSRSGAQTAVDLARLAKAIYNIVRAAIAAGLYGAAVAAAKEALPFLVKVSAWVIFLFIFFPLLVFVSLPNIFFGFGSSDTDPLVHMTGQALTIGGAYIRIDVKHCASESYREMKARQQREVNGFPKAFAFSDRQFVEGMRSLGLDPADRDKIVFIGGGGFIRKTDEAAFQAMFQRHRLERETAMDADQTGNGYLLEMFCCEFANHEYGYTRDAEPALMALGISWEDIGGDERLLHAFETACCQEAEWYDKHCGV